MRRLIDTWSKNKLLKPGYRVYTRTLDTEWKLTYKNMSLDHAVFNSFKEAEKLAYSLWECLIKIEKDGEFVALYQNGRRITRK